MLSHSASWYAQFPADLCESAFVNRLRESGAWIERTPLQHSY